MAGLVWRVAGRVRWGGTPFVLAVLAATRYAGRSDSPQWDAMTSLGAVIALAAGLGAAILLSDPQVSWGWVAAGSLVSAGGVWAAVPETGPAVLAGGALFGVGAAAFVTRCRWGPTAGLGAAAVVGWAALSGAAGRPWAAVGGALCTGLSPWLLAASGRRLRPWLLGAHILLVVAAARWIGVAPEAGWGRVAVVAAAGLAMAMATRRGA